MTTVEEVAKVTLPKWVTTDQKNIIEGAQMTGWTLHLSKTGVALRLVAPDGKVIFIRQKASHNRKEMMRVIVKHGDPLKVAMASASLTLPKENRDATLVKIGEAAERRVVVHERQEEGEKCNFCRLNNTWVDGRCTNCGKTKADEALSGYVDVPDQVLAGPGELLMPVKTILSRQPMLASRSKHTGYHSSTTEVITHSDGSKAYGCTLCDFTSEDRLAPSRHYGGVHSKGKQQTPETFKATVQDTAHYKPRQSRVNALAAFLHENVTGNPEDFEVVARLALNWQHEQSKKGTEFAAEAEELTPEETLMRIRRLLDTGQMAEQQKRVEELEQRLVFQAEQLARADELILEAEHRARRAQDTLHSFVELARDLDKEDK